jgi:hypothetical protein
MKAVRASRKINPRDYNGLNGVPSDPCGQMSSEE